MCVVVVDVDPEHVLDVATVQDQRPVEALAPGGADEALNDRIRLRHAYRCVELRRS
jgi:hypothetical protein